MHLLGNWPSLNQPERKCAAMGKSTREKAVATLLILVKQDEMLEPHLYLDTNQQKEMHVEIKGAD
jgi:hypothetical protein